MIIFKPKDFYVTKPEDSLQISENPVRYVPVCFEIWNVEKILVTYSKDYQSDMFKMGPLTKKKIKSLINDIKKGYLYIDNPNNDESYTHALPKYSDNRRIIWSKSVSAIDRITYAIYRPEEYGTSDDSSVTLQVKILSCKNHKISKEKQYTDNGEIN